ncbi:MAG: hypothetical protein AB7N76_08125 [Planctomycetota bacterium]
MILSRSSRLAPAFLALLLSPAFAQPTPQPRVQPGGPQPGDLERVFGPDGAVLVPYDELLRLIRGETPTPVDPPVTDLRPPSGFALVGAAVGARVDEGVVRCEATVDVDLVGRGGWTLVPLGLEQAALESATVGGQPAIVGQTHLLAQRIPAAERPASIAGYGVLLQGTGRRTLKLAFTLALQKKPGQAGFELSLPGAALTKVSLAVPQASRDLSVEHALAHQPASEGVVSAFFEAGAKARFAWTPRPSAAVRQPSARVKALVYADANTAVQLEEGLLRTTAVIHYRIHQAPVEELRLRVPAGATVLGATGPYVSRFPEVTRKGDAQEVLVRLSEPRQGELALTLKLEQLLREGAELVPIPAVSPLGAERSSGRVAVGASQFLTLEPQQTSGLSKVEATDFPIALLQTALGWQPGGEQQAPLTFRYPREPWTLQVAARQVQAEVEAKLHTLAVVGDDETGLATSVAITVRKRPIFSLRFALPRDYQFLDFGDPSAVKDRRVEDGKGPDGADGKVLVLELARPLPPGQHDLLIFGSVRRAQGDEVELPRLSLLGAAKETGVVGVAAVSHLQLSARQKEGLWSLALSDLAAQGFPLGVKAGEELAFAYRYGPARGGRGGRASFSVQKREPRVRARTETLVDCQEDQVRVESEVHFEVEYAGIDRVELRGPAALAKALVFDHDGITGADAKVEGERATWTVRLQGKRSGAFSLRCHYAIKLDDFAAGQQKVVPIPPLEVLGCARQSEEIAVKKHENLVLADAARDLVETRDPREVAPALRKPGVIRAYRVQGWPFRLSLEVTKYDFREPQGILIRHLHQTEVVGEKGGLQAEALLSVQNRSEQYLTVLLPPGATVRGLKVDGKTETFHLESKDGRPTLLIDLGPVTKARQGEPFQIRLRYNAPLVVPRATGALEPLALEFPREKGAVPVARHTRSLYLPKGYAFLSFDVEGTKHFEERGVWATLTGELRALRGQPLRPDALRRGAQAARDAIVRLEAMGGRQAGVYEALDLPRDRQDHLFERLGGGLSVSARVMAWPLFYLLDLLILVAVVALGFTVDKRQLLPSPWIFPLVAGALSMAGGAVLGRALEPFFAAAFLGSVGLVAFFLLRGALREVTERQAARNAERTEREAQVARERAAAAEAEARLQEAQA